MEDEELIIDDLPEVPESEPEVVVTEKPEAPTVDDTVEALKAQLDEERRAREASERRAIDAAQQATQADRRAQESELNLVTNAIGGLERTNEELQRRLAEAHADSDYGLVADIQVALATNISNLSKLREGKQAMEQAPAQSRSSGNPVEDLASQLSPRSAEWIRKNPQFASDQRLFQKMIAAHNYVTADGTQADTDAYFGQIEKMLGIGSSDDVPALQPARQAAPAAAPVSRSSTGTGGSNPNRVTLTAAEREIAEMMQMSYQEYAKQKLAIEKESRH